MRKKKKNLNIGTLIRSIGFIIEFVMKLLNLMTLISFIVLGDSLGLENPFNGLVDEIWEGGRVLTQE